MWLSTKVSHDERSGSSPFANIHSPAGIRSRTLANVVVALRLARAAPCSVLVLTLEGEHKRHKEEDDETFHRVENFYGKFSRMFTLPDNIDESKIRAECKDGVLKVHMPKTKATTPELSKEINNIDLGLIQPNARLNCSIIQAAHGEPTLKSLPRMAPAR